MQDEQTWLERQEDVDSAALERYEYFTRPEPRENMSDIYVEDDPYLGRVKCRDVKVGMLRNAAPENRKTLKAYLEPFPHIRVDNIKPLQGWYKSKVERPNVRPRPCLLPGTLVSTPAGDVPVEEVRVGDLVLGLDMETGVVTPTVVRGTARQIKSRYLELVLEGGTVLRLTPEHLVYTKGRGWVEAQALTPEDDLLALAEEALPCLKDE